MVAFAPGQRWHYQTRPGEEGSIATILKIEDYPGVGQTVHVTVDGLLLRSPRSPDGFSRTIGHLPISEEAFAASVTELVGIQDDLSGLFAGYDEWKRARGGVFTLPLRDIIDLIEKGLNQVPLGSPQSPGEG